MKKRLQDGREKGKVSFPSPRRVDRNPSDGGVSKCGPSAPEKKTNSQGAREMPRIQKKGSCRKAGFGWPVMRFLFRGGVKGWTTTGARGTARGD